MTTLEEIARQGDSGGLRQAEQVKKIKFRESLGLEQEDLVNRFRHLRAVLKESFARERRARLLPGAVASV